MLLDYMIPRRLLHLDETVLGIADLGDDMALCDWSRLGTDADEAPHEPARDVLTRRYSGLVESFITRTGRELSDADIEALADEAERGYDLSKAKRIVIGRPSHGAKTVSRRVEVRVDPDLAATLRARAHAEHRSVSEIVRIALREYLDRTA